jgi:hypothetical protein
MSNINNEDFSNGTFFAKKKSAVICGNKIRKNLRDSK